MKKQVNDKITVNKIKLYHADRSNISLRDQIFQENLQMVCKLVSRFNSKQGYKHQDQDLIQIGAIGLLRAIELYKGTNGAKFSTYAYVKIIGAILDGLKKQSSSKMKLNKLLKLLNDQTIKIKQQYGINITLDQLNIFSEKQKEVLKQHQFYVNRKQKQYDSVLDQLCEREDNDDYFFKD